jgi:hypothetical protein
MLKTRLLAPLFAMFFSVVLALPANAGLVGTDQVATPQQSERDRVQALVARPDVAKKLEMLGVMPKDAQSRINALTDAEVASLAARIDALPAGGLSNMEWLLVVIAVLVLIIAL